MNTRATVVEYEDAVAEVRAVYDEIMQAMGMPWVLNWFKCQAQSPVLLRGNWEKVRTTLLEGRIPLLLKQLILFKVSRDRGCKYCTFVHKTAAEELARESEISADITVDLEAAAIPESYRTAIEVVSRCALDPLSTAAEDFAALSAVGYDEAEIQELFAQADLVNMLNTIADIHGIEIDEEFFAMR